MKRSCFTYLLVLLMIVGVSCAQPGMTGDGDGMHKNPEFDPDTMVETLHVGFREEPSEAFSVTAYVTEGYRDDWTYLWRYSGTTDNRYVNEYEIDVRNELEFGKTYTIEVIAADINNKIIARGNASISRTDSMDLVYSVSDPVAHECTVKAYFDVEGGEPSDLSYAWTVKGPEGESIEYAEPQPGMISFIWKGAGKVSVSCTAAGSGASYEDSIDFSLTEEGIIGNDLFIGGQAGTIMGLNHVYAFSPVFTFYKDGFTAEDYDAYTYRWMEDGLLAESVQATPRMKPNQAFLDVSRKLDSFKGDSTDIRISCIATNRNDPDDVLYAEKTVTYRPFINVISHPKHNGADIWFEVDDDLSQYKFKLYVGCPETSEGEKLANGNWLGVNWITDATNKFSFRQGEHEYYLRLKGTLPDVKERNTAVYSRQYRFMYDYDTDTHVWLTDL